MNLCDEVFRKHILNIMVILNIGSDVKNPLYSQSWHTQISSIFFLPFKFVLMSTVHVTVVISANFQNAFDFSLWYKQIHFRRFVYFYTFIPFSFRTSHLCLDRSERDVAKNTIWGGRGSWNLVLSLSVLILSVLWSFIAKNWWATKITE